MFDEIGYEQEQRLARRQRAQAVTVYEMARAEREEMQALLARMDAIEQRMTRLEAATAKLASLAATVAVA